MAKYVNYELSKELQKKGYDEPSYCLYTLGLNKNEFKQLSFHIDYRQACSIGPIIPIENNFMAIRKKNSDYGHAPIAPLYEEVFDWFDDIHKIRIDLTHSDSTGKYNYTIWKWNFDNNVGKWERISCLGLFSTKEERNIDAITNALKLI